MLRAATGFNLLLSRIRCSLEPERVRGNGIANPNIFREQRKKSKTFGCSSHPEPHLPYPCWNNLTISLGATRALMGAVGAWHQVPALLCILPTPWPNSQCPQCWVRPPAARFQQRGLVLHHPLAELHLSLLLPCGDISCKAPCGLG